MNLYHLFLWWFSPLLLPGFVIGSFGPFTNITTCRTVLQCEPSFASNTTLASNSYSNTHPTSITDSPSITSSFPKVDWVFSTGDPNKGLPHTGTGPEYVSKCNSLISDWSRSESIYYKSIDSRSSVSYRIPSTTLSYTWTQTHYTYTEFFTECDGRVRVKGGITSISTNTVKHPSWGVVRPVFFREAQPYPDCTIARGDCHTLWKEYWAKSPRPTAEPNCVGECGACMINVGKVELLFSPVPTTVTRDMCASSFYDSPEPTAPTKEKTNPEFISFKGTKLDLRSAYLSFQTAYATDGCGRTIGKVHSGGIISLPSKDLSTINYISTYPSLEGLHGRKLNFADLNHPIPYSAAMETDYMHRILDWCDDQLPNTPWCINILHGPNSTVLTSILSQVEPINSNWSIRVIVDEMIHPTLVAPQAIRTLDPAWTDCVVPLGGIYDPPYALPTANSIYSNSKPEPLPPVPGSPIGSPLATKTPSSTEGGDHGGQQGAVSKTDNGKPTLSDQIGEVMVLRIGDTTIEVRRISGENGAILLPDGSKVRPGEKRTINGIEYAIGPAIIVNGQSVANMSAGADKNKSICPVAVLLPTAWQTTPDTQARLTIASDFTSATATERVLTPTKGPKIHSKSSSSTRQKRIDRVVGLPILGVLAFLMV